MLDHATMGCGLHYVALPDQRGETTKSEDKSENVTMELENHKYPVRSPLSVHTYSNKNLFNFCNIYETIS